MTTSALRYPITPQEDAVEMAHYVSSMNRDDAAGYLFEVLGEEQAATITAIVERMFGEPHGGGAGAIHAALTAPSCIFFLLMS